MSSDWISPSNLPPLSCSARLSASTSKLRGSRPAAVSVGRSTISSAPTVTGIRSSGMGEREIIYVFTLFFFSLSQQGRHHLEERPFGRVSKDGRNAWTRGHPSRRAQGALLRMRSEIYSH